MLNSDGSYKLKTKDGAYLTVKPYKNPINLFTKNKRLKLIADEFQDEYKSGTAIKHPSLYLSITPSPDAGMLRVRH